MIRELTVNPTGPTMATKNVGRLTGRRSEASGVFERMGGLGKGGSGEV